MSSVRVSFITGQWLCWFAAAVMASAQPVLVAPGSNAVNIGSAPILQVSASSSGGTPLTVAYYGRIAAPGSNFTLVALPDTQYYVSSKNGGSPGMFYAQTDWIL